MGTIEKAYQAFCEERFPVPTRDQVADLERRLRIQLPGHYREYLLSHNGGFFSEPDITPPSDDCPLDSLTTMAGLNAPDPSAELGAPGGFTPSWLEDNDPPVLLPIGYTLAGNLLYLVTEPGEEDYGWIGIKLKSSNRSFFLASSMEEFFAGLRGSDAERAGSAAK